MSRAKRRTGRTRKQPKNVRLLLLTGIPGAGKTTAGEHLCKQKGFRHLDLEHGPTLQRYRGVPLPVFKDRIGGLKKTGRDIVITWGFVPDGDLDYVLALHALGFKWFWFDGNRDVARRAFVERGGVSEELLDRQLAKIERYLDLDALAPSRLDPFNDEGQFRSSDAIAAELLS